MHHYTGMHVSNINEFFGLELVKNTEKLPTFPNKNQVKLNRLIEGCKIM